MASDVADGGDAFTVSIIKQQLRSIRSLATHPPVRFFKTSNSIKPTFPAYTKSSSPSF
jgi:hypothetical protein